MTAPVRVCAGPTIRPATRPATGVATGVARMPLSVPGPTPAGAVCPHPRNGPPSIGAAA
jgi:hypothetical protein